MKLTSKKKYWKYAFWIGPCLIVMGLSAAVVSSSWVPVPAGLIIAGFVCFGLWLVFQGEQFWGQRSTQAGTNALVATVSVLAILGLINFMAVRYPQRLDLTENKQFTLAPQTQELVRNLRQPVKVLLFEKTPEPRDQELLENYQRQNSGKFNFEVVDPQASPTVAQQYGVTRFGEVHLEYGDKKQFLMTVDPQSSRLTESKLTNGIAQIISTGTTKVYFLQGHGEQTLTPGERGISQAIKTLQNRNITSEPLNLAEQSEVPKDAATLVIAGPQRTLFDGEIKALKDYLNRGGSLMVMVDPNVDPKLSGLLDEWGVKLDPRLIVDASGQGQLVGLGPAEPLITNYGDHPITKDFKNGYSFYRGARPLETRPVEGIEETPLLITNERSWAESNPQKQPLRFNKETDRQGPLLLGVALTRKIDKAAGKDSPQSSAGATDKPKADSSPSPSPSPTDKPKSDTNPSPKPTESPAATKEPETPAQQARMVVIGNSSFATDGMFNEQLNGDVFLNSVSWLSKQDAPLLSIRPKERTNRRINMTAQQALLLGWGALAIVPLIGFGLAAILWWRRR